MLLLPLVPKRFSFFRISLLLLALVAFAPQPAAAQEWVVMESKSAVFKAKMPRGFEEIYSSMRIGPITVATMGETHATIDQNPYVNAEKKYIVKVEQTLGGYLTAQDRGEILDSELMRYINFYKAQGGDVLSVEDNQYQYGFPASEIQVVYDTEQFGRQYARVRLITSDVTLIHQIVIGPENTMNSYKTRDYFTSFRPMDGFKRSDGRIEDEWKELYSPLQIFKIRVPEPNVFMPEAPSIQNSDSVERVMTRFYDPVWKQSLFYNVYGYRTERALTYYDAEELLRSRHILRHRKTNSTVDCKKLKNGNLPILECQYTMIPPEGFPYISNVRLRAIFFKNYIMVNEILASKNLINIPFVQEIILKGEFLRGPAEGTGPQ